MTLIITSQNGTSFNFRDMGIRVLNFEPESLNTNHTIESVSGGSYVVSDSYIVERYIDVELQFLAADIGDYVLLRRELFNLLAGTQWFYVVDEREPNKRWQVFPNDQFQTEREGLKGIVSLRWLCRNKYAESVYTAQEIITLGDGVDTKKVWDPGLFAWDGSTDWEETLNYNFNTNQFDVQNLGTAPVDPRTDFLDIEVRGNFGPFFEILSLTNRSVYRVDLTATPTDRIFLTGVQSFKNDTSIFLPSNKRVIVLEPGNNDFIITGGTVESVRFNFRYLYK